MKNALISIICLCFAGLVTANTPSPFHVKEIKLSNGLTVWLNEDHSQPKIFGAVVVKAGAKDSPNTGIAHYFEHMMFKGTDKIGTTDYASERIFLDSIVDKYDELAKTTQEDERMAIQKEINRLSIKAAEYAIPNEFSRLISRYGGTGLNAFTSNDCTVYHNTFSSPYFSQWAELNSERLINPVFRLFQSELETVYEEKNMYNNFPISKAMMEVLEKIFTPHPYAYSVIGSTENLKNPKLSDMEAFFQKYYVANNMGLILCGDFNEKQILPVLENTFGRIRKGDITREQFAAPAPFKGREKFTFKIPIPILKMAMLGFRGIPANHPDEAALDITIRLLTNNNGTGYLDMLSVHNKLMQAGAFTQSLNDAGVIGMLIIPKLLFQSNKKAEKLVINEVERIKNGDFSDELFESLKLEASYEQEKSMENSEYRSMIMISLFSQGGSWDEYLSQQRKIETLTKEDIINTAKKYFGKNYLAAYKKTGKQTNDKLSKPPFDPIIPKHSDLSSQYAKTLGNHVPDAGSLRYIDFEKEAQTIALSPKATLYMVPNPMNSLFSMEVSFQVGSRKAPATDILAEYLLLLGTDSLSYEQLRKELQQIGSTFEINAGYNRFSVSINGFDQKFEETMQLVGHLLHNAKADKKKLKTMIDALKVNEKVFFKSAESIADAAIEKVMYGEESDFLIQLSYKESKKLNDKQLFELFDQIKRTSCSIHYSGTLSAKKVSEGIDHLIDIDQIDQSAQTILYRNFLTYDKPTVYFFDSPRATQSIIYAYVPNKLDENPHNEAMAQLFSDYFGTDMSSIMFQELREFRSFAYRASGRYIVPPPVCQKDKNSALKAMLSTQCDKTIDAMNVLDSLIRFMPQKPEKVTEARQRFFNSVNNHYPNFREISSVIHSYKTKGYTEDPNRLLISHQRGMNMNDLNTFYEKNIKEQPVIYIVVGDPKKIEMEKLASFGEIVHLKKEDIYK